MSQNLPVIAQNSDIRFLGKLLGDVIRRQGGESLFQRIEAWSHQRWVNGGWVFRAGAPGG
jgi:phosphoenolpyruvate carboxylase